MFIKDIHIEYHFLWLKFTSDSERDFLIKASNNNMHITLSFFCNKQTVSLSGVKEYIYLDLQYYHYMAIFKTPNA